MLEKLIGAKLIEINDEYIEVEKNGKTYFIDIEDEPGDCCGYNDISTKLLLDDISKPIITNIKTECNDEAEGDECLITFFGEYKPIAELHSFSYSGSGWGYGACVTLKCKKLNIEETITNW